MALSMPFLLCACSPKPAATLAAPAEIRQEISGSDASLLLVHAWATWCQPCREEFPELIAACRQYRSRGLELLLVSADSPDELDAVQAFLAEYRSPAGSLVSTRLDAEFMEALSPGWGGSLPASFFYADGRLLAEWEGQRSYEHYIETMDQLLDTVKGAKP